MREINILIAHKDIRDLHTIFYYLYDHPDYNILSASGLEMVLTIVKEKYIDLIIIDIDAILKNQEAFFNTLSATSLEKEISVILVSQQDLESFFITSYNQFVIDFLKKPVLKGELLFRISHITQTKETRKNLADINISKIAFETEVDKLVAVQIAKAGEELAFQYKQNIEALELEKSQLSNQLAAIETESQKINLEKEELKNNLQNISTEKTKLEQAFYSIEDERSKLQKSILEIESEKSQLQSVIHNYETLLQSQENNHQEEIYKEELQRQKDLVAIENQKFEIAKAELEKQRTALENKLKEVEIEKQRIQEQLISNSLEIKDTMTKAFKEADLIPVFEYILPVELSQKIKAADDAQDIHYYSRTATLLIHINQPELIEEYLPSLEEAVNKYKLEKITGAKNVMTYLSGLGEQEDRQPEKNAIYAALEIKQILSQVIFRYPDLQINICVNTGGLIAGSIAGKKFGYDVWGDMSQITKATSKDKQMFISIMEDGYKFVSQDVICEYIGETMTKRNGRVKVYEVRNFRIIQ